MDSFYLQNLVWGGKGGGGGGNGDFLMQFIQAMVLGRKKCKRELCKA